MKQKKRDYFYGRSISDETKKKEHRGEGTGAEYKPWIRAQEFKSNQGGATVIIDPYTKRDVHLLSIGEVMAWYILRYDPSVTDIREQFPINIDITKKICEKYGIDHPRKNSPKGYQESVMTSDLLVDFADGSEKVYSIKYNNSYLVDESARKNLFIEKMYWNQKGIEFIIITREDLEPMRIFVANLRNAFYIADKEQVHDLYSFVQYKITHHMIEVDLMKDILDLDQIIADNPSLKNEYDDFLKEMNSNGSFND